MNWVTRPILGKSILLQEYSEKMLRTLLDRFKKQTDGNFTEEEILARIRRFEVTKDSKANELRTFVQQQIDNRVEPFVAQPPAPEEADIAPGMRSKSEQDLLRVRNNPTQLEFYTWPQLEKIYDTFIPAREREAMKKKQQELAKAKTTAPLPVVFEDDKITVYYGESSGGCHDFQIWLRNENGKEIDKAIKSGFKGSRAEGSLAYVPTNWYHYCIGFGGGGNAWNSYRYRTPLQTIYYIVDRTKPVTDPRHASVLQKIENEDRYLITNAFNNQEAYYTWRQALELNPNWAPAKDVIKDVEMTDREKIVRALRDVTPRNFDQQSDVIKDAYINAPTGTPPQPRQINKNDYLKLPENLQEAYIHRRAPQPGTHPSVQLQRLIDNLFADTPKEEFINRRNAAIQAKSQKDPNWIEYLYDDPIVKQSKNKEVFKYYKRLIKQFLNGLATGNAGPVAGPAQPGGN